MKCEEFEAIGLDAERDASLSEAERAAAREHAATCSHCAALQDSWEAAGIELRALAEDTAMVQTPARVEMRFAPGIPHAACDTKSSPHRGSCGMGAGHRRCAGRHSELGQLAQEQFECSGGPFEIFTECSEFRCERRELREQSRGAGCTAGFRGFRNAYGRQRIERLHAAPGNFAGGYLGCRYFARAYATQLVGRAGPARE